jgi:hypothetical protein
MVATFFFAATPHDFIHDEIASHKDTIDHYHKHPGVSKVHIHCDFLRESLSPSLPGNPAAVHFNISEYNICFEAPVLSSPQHLTFHYFLRGPPVTC